MADFNIDGYATRIWSSRSTTNKSPGTAVAGIYLYQGNTYKGYIYFYPDGTELSPPLYHEPSDRIFIHLNLSQFHSTVEILRTEKPLYFYYYNTSNAGLRSGKEPVGEEE